VRKLSGQNLTFESDRTVGAMKCASLVPGQGAKGKKRPVAEVGRVRLLAALRRDVSSPFSGCRTLERSQRQSR